MSSPRNQGEDHGSGEEPEFAAVKDSPAYGAWNVQTVTAVTGETPVGSVGCDLVTDEAGSITGEPGK